MNKHPTETYYMTRIMRIQGEGVTSVTSQPPELLRGWRETSIMTFIMPSNRSLVNLFDPLYYDSVRLSARLSLFLSVWGLPIYLKIILYIMSLSPVLKHS